MLTRLSFGWEGVLITVFGDTVPLQIANITPWKINMEPNQPFRMEKWSSKPPWLCSMLIFQGAQYQIKVKRKRILSVCLLFFVPTAKAGVLLATLACIEFFDDIQIPRRLPHSFRIVDVAADGRCFWSSLFLGVQASRAELFSWGARGRSQRGFCYGKKDLELEQKLVLAFGENLTSMPVGCRERFERGLCAHDKDFDSSLS